MVVWALCGACLRSSWNACKPEAGRNNQSTHKGIAKMKLCKHTKPVMTANGLSMVEPSHAWRRNLSKETADQFIQRTLDMVAENTIISFSGVSKFEEPSEWEFSFLTRGFRSHRGITYAEYEAKRRPLIGAYSILVNFEEVSHSVRITTKDVQLLSAFTEAFRTNRGERAASLYHERVEEEFENDRRMFFRRQEKARGTNHS